MALDVIGVFWYAHPIIIYGASSSVGSRNSMFLDHTEDDVTTYVRQEKER